jgi:hypothetical protein
VGELFGSHISDKDLIYRTIEKFYNPTINNSIKNGHGLGYFFREDI